MTESKRAYMYRVGVAVVPLLVAYGALNERDAALWLGVLGAVLGLGMAAANTSTKPDEG